MEHINKILVWFSAGAASAIAAKYAVKKYGDLSRVIYCDTGGEHPDNKRFLKDIESWIDYPIEILKNEKYKDHFDCLEKTQSLFAPAQCTIQLKKKIRFKIQNIDDIHVFGYTAEESHRAERFEQSNPELKTWWPLIEHNVSKEDCLGILWKAKLKIPVMYELGYNHNNCIGCIQGGQGYWNKIRIDFPEQFERMAKLERKLKKSVLKTVDGPLYLDELDPNAGNFAKEPPISCGLGCQLATMDLAI